MVDLFYLILVEESASVWESRAKTRERIDAAVARDGAAIVAAMRWATVAAVRVQQWRDDPGNEAGQAGLMALASGG